MEQLVICSLVVTSVFLWMHKRLISSYLKIASTYQEGINNSPVTRVIGEKNSNIAYILKQATVYALSFIFIFCILNLISGNPIFSYRNNNQAYTDSSNYPNSTNNEQNQDYNYSPNSTKKIFEITPASQLKTSFKDIAGVEEVKQESIDTINYLKNPSHYTRLGAKPPKGLLFYGPPGTGKTLLARAIAGEAKVNFISTSGSQFDEEYVGVGAARVRQLFKFARENAPCIVFIDEIDSAAHNRASNKESWQSQTVNQLLTELDGLNQNANDNIIIIGATNRIQSIDKAVLRPGRFDKKIKFELPTKEERESIAKVHLREITYDKEVTPEHIAKISIGFSSAEIANLVNEATLHATRTDKQAVDLESVEIAKDQLVLGAKRSIKQLTAKELKQTAYHEAGHALVNYFLPNRPEIYKVTITPRGQSLGTTHFNPKTEEFSINKAELEQELITCLGGRVAEKLIFGENNITTGAASDLQRATQIAQNMVTKWGFSEQMGLVYHDESQDDKLLTQKEIRTEVVKILKAAEFKATQIIEKNKDKLETIAKSLLEHETLDNNQFIKLMQ